MAFTVEDFQDLLELLRAHLDWRQKLWEQLAAEELLRLPAEVRAFREKFGRLRKGVRQRFERIDRRSALLARIQRRHYEESMAYRAEIDRRFAELAEAQQRTEEQVRQLIEALRQLMERVDRLERRTEDRARDLGELKKYNMESRYREQSARIFRGPLREAKPIPYELGSPGGVRRAVERAAIFARALQAEVWPMVGAEALTDPARKAARDLQVWWVRDGRAFPL